MLPGSKWYNLMIRYLVLLIVFSSFISLCTLSAVPCMAAEGQLMAGTGKISITPENPPIPVHDLCYARSLVLELGEQRVAIISVDMAVFTSERVVRECKEKYEIDLVLISSSHNHSGPRAPEGVSMQKFAEDRCIEVVGTALENMFPARISAGHRSFPQLGFNRLIVREDGHARESWFEDDHYRRENPDRIPFGPVDPEVGVIRIDDMEGNPKVILMNYAMHTDIMCFNYEITADFSGVATAKVEEAFGENVNCLFVNGAAGNVESLQISRRRTGPDDPIKGQYEVMDRVGELLAREAIKLAKSLKPGEERTKLAQMSDSVGFTGRFNKELQFDVHLATILINDRIVIAACPGELFSQLQLYWKKEMRLAETEPFFFGYTWTAGKWPGYVPDIRSAALGGFGADQSGGMIEVGAGERMVNKQLENFYKLNGLMREKPYSPPPHVRQ